MIHKVARPIAFGALGGLIVMTLAGVMSQPFPFWLTIVVLLVFTGSLLVEVITRPSKKAGNNPI